MGIIVDKNHLSAKRAIEIAELIARVNPFITARILDQFRKRISR